MSGPSRAIRLAALAALLVAPAVTALPTASATSPDLHRASAPPTHLSAMPTGGPAGPATPRASLRRHAPLVPDAAAYARQKAAADRAATNRSGTPAAAGRLAPSQVNNFAGVTDSTGSPSDSTGAAGVSRYIELVNSRFAIYDRPSTLLASNTLNVLMGAGISDNVFDPQVIWDPGTGRFYYTADDIDATGNNRLLVGFSKGSSPKSSSDFCKYNLNYGTLDFPDYPKLGDTQNFLLIGVNVFTGASSTYTGSDVVAISKPSSNATCTSYSPKVNIKQDLTNANGSRAFTPVPANQTDPGTTGWVVARPVALPAAYVSLFKVTRSSTGHAAFGVPKNVPVDAYNVPANARQLNSNRLIDTSDARMTQAVVAFDGRIGSGGLWTQHTVAGGAGAAVRWYEIDVNHAKLFQQGQRDSATRFLFNGAISPDRRRQGTEKKYGSSMVLNYNASSLTQYPDVEVVSKIKGYAVSSPKVVATSPGPQQDFTCSTAGSVCRWGDYAAATPDPNANRSYAHGAVWGTSQYTRDGRAAPNSVNWVTRNFTYRP